MSRVLPSWTVSPLTRVPDAQPSAGSPASSAVTSGPIGPLRSAFLPSVHCAVSFWARAGGEVVERGVAEHRRPARWRRRRRSAARRRRRRPRPPSPGPARSRAPARARRRRVSEAVQRPKSGRVLGDVEAALGGVRPVVQPDADHPGRRAGPAARAVPTRRGALRRCLGGLGRPAPGKVRVEVGRRRPRGGPGRRPARRRGPAPGARIPGELHASPLPSRTGTSLGRSRSPRTGHRCPPSAAVGSMSATG